MSTITGSTQIRIDTGVKSRLESYRDTVRGVKTHSDAIDRLLNYYSVSEQENVELSKSSDLEKKRRGLEDITLGEDRKNLLIVFKEKYGLSDINSMLDVMIHHFETSDSLSKDTLHLLLSLQR